MGDEIVRLTYTDSRGLAEPIRILLTVAGIKFQDVSFKDHDHYLRVLKTGKMFFGQTPLLEIDGLNLVQQRACLNYVAKKAGMLGTTNAEFAKIVMLFEGTRDAMAPYIQTYFVHTKEEGMKLVKASTIDKYFPIFNKALEESTSGYLVGSSMTLADVGLFEVLMYTNENFTPDTFDPFPALKGYNDRLCADEKIIHYMKHIAKQRPSPEVTAYVKMVYKHKYHK